MRLVFRSLVFAFALIGIVGSGYHLAILTKAGRGWLGIQDTLHFEKPVAMVKLSELRYEFAIEGTIPMITMDYTIANDNPYPVDTVVTRCVLRDGSSHDNGSFSINYYTVLPANSQKEFKGVRVLQVSPAARSAMCTVADVQHHYN